MELIDIHHSLRLVEHMLTDASSRSLKLSGLDAHILDQAALVANPLEASTSLTSYLSVGFTCLFLLGITCTLIVVYIRNRQTFRYGFLHHAKPISSVLSSIQQWHEVKEQILSSNLPAISKEHYIDSLAHLQKDQIEEMRALSTCQVTNTDLRYLLCFYIGMTIQEISSIFRVAQVITTLLLRT